MGRGARSSAWRWCGEARRLTARALLPNVPPLMKPFARIPMPTSMAMRRPDSEFSLRAGTATLA